ncbi:MAG: hypothetical protein JWN70_851 [Planctomycetaceae bacterium]|nr:hypothetical protein [Planctomycetaceae bacterium]
MVYSLPSTLSPQASCRGDFFDLFDFFGVSRHFFVRRMAAPAVSFS